MTKKRGFTLVEMVAVIGVGSVLLVLATGVVQRAMKLDSQWHHHADVSRSLTRFSHDLRRDTHEAESVSVSEEPAKIQLSLPLGQTVNYTITDTEIARISEIDGAEPQREYYKKPADYRAILSKLSSPERIEVQINHDSNLVNQPPRMVMHVEAQVGRLLLLGRHEEPKP